MVFKHICILVLLKKIAAELEGLRLNSPLARGKGGVVLQEVTTHGVWSAVRWGCTRMLAYGCEGMWWE